MKTLVIIFAIVATITLFFVGMWGISMNINIKVNGVDVAKLFEKLTMIALIAFCISVMPIITIGLKGMGFMMLGIGVDFALISVIVMAIDFIKMKF